MNFILTIVHISNDEHYERQINEFETGVKKLYNLGQTSFLTKHLVEPKIHFTFISSDTTFPEFQESLGRYTIGFFTMKGFERHNKEQNKC